MTDTSHPSGPAAIVDYFAGPYKTPQEQRLRYVARNGVQHASVITPRDPLPGQPVRIAILTAVALPIDRVAVYSTADGSDPTGRCGEASSGQVTLAAPVGGEMARMGDVEAHRWEAELPGQPDGTFVRYRIDAWSSEDPARRWVADAADPFAAPAHEGREFAYHVDRRTPPAWLADAIVYQIFVDRFAAAPDEPPLRVPGADPDDLTTFLGGTIRGITSKLDYLAELGVNCLWLTPVMESPSYHSYNPSCYTEVSRRFGTNEDLRALIAAAHVRGMRVLLDFVANHTSDEHPAFVAARSDPHGSAAQWYTLGPQYATGYLSYYGVHSMPVLRTERAAVRQYLIDAARDWLLDLGADGLRLDNVSGPTHAFWTHFQEGVKARVPGGLTLGEITGTMVDIRSYGGRLDACMDFPLTTALRQVFAQRVAPLETLLSLAATHDAEFPPAMARARLLDNHDMHRFLFLAENDTNRLLLALAFLMALPGFPILYYGTEVGLSQRATATNTDRYAREPMPWGAEQRQDVLRAVRALIGLRHRLSALRHGQLAPLPVRVTRGEDRQVGALVRWLAATDGGPVDGTERGTEGVVAVVAVFNNGATAAECALDPRAAPGIPGLGEGALVREVWRCEGGVVQREEVSTPSAEWSGQISSLGAIFLLCGQPRL